MRKFFLSVLRVVMIGALMTPVMSCEPEIDNEVEQEGTTNDDPSKNTTDIAVTGLVVEYGITYATMSGYVNLNLLPPGEGAPSFGVELTVDDASKRCEKSESLIGNEFFVEFSGGLLPNTKYKYRTFVTFSGITHYGDYKTVTTKDVVNITSPGDAFDITTSTANISLLINRDMTNPKDSLNIGVGYTSIKAQLHPDSAFYGGEWPLCSLSENEYTIGLKGLKAATTYYYTTFTSVGGVYKLGEIKSFTMKDGGACNDGNHIHAVDLGLSVKWACCNVGAKSPEEYGDYFAWGETEAKSYYINDNSLTYELSTSELESRGIIGSDGNLTASYDAATANWGSPWRMPTLDEIKELIDDCTWSWTTQNGISGYKVTGPNGNSIFLPTAGYLNGGSLRNEGSDGNGNYWAATSYGDNLSACSLCFDWGYHGLDFYYRCYGRTVRPVSE